MLVIHCVQKQRTKDSSTSEDEVMCLPQNAIEEMSFTDIFTNISKEEEQIFPLTMAEIAQEQQ